MLLMSVRSFFIVLFFFLNLGYDETGHRKFDTRPKDYVGRTQLGVIFGEPVDHTPLSHDECDARLDPLLREERIFAAVDVADFGYEPLDVVPSEEPFLFHFIML